MGRGFRDVISNKAVISLNDFSGMKIRVPESDIYLSTFKAMNANPTPLRLTMYLHRCSKERLTDSR